MPYLRSDHTAGAIQYEAIVVRGIGNDKYGTGNGNRDAYRQALEYATGRIRDLCHSRGAQYMLVSAHDTMQDIFFERLLNMGVLK